MLGDDAELTAAVLAAQGGDENAFRTVYRAVHPRLLGYTRTLVGDGDAEDVTSEAWLQIARDLAGFEGDADRFRGWTARIARNRALDHIRMRGRRPAVGGDETELTARPAESDTAGEAIEALATGRTMALIARLPRDQAEAVVLRVVVGLDAKSAAETLGKRPGAVRTAAHRGLKKLAELIGAELDPVTTGPATVTAATAAGGAVPGPRANGIGTGIAGKVGDNATGRTAVGRSATGTGRDLDAVPAQRGPGRPRTHRPGATHTLRRAPEDL
ncbi:RNA polymerase sigma factor [Streptomyces sp. BI20]|uniref:RNA polymerase sigma factor n=1 Tax=Streptomyces sp. BI20 TaxID=3403460 RepID=UPI003C719431